MNPLTDILSPRARKYVYAVLSLATLVFGVYQASQGDWTLFVGSLLTSLGTTTAASNVATGTYPDPPEYVDPQADPEPGVIEPDEEPEDPDPAAVDPALRRLQ